jgi:hypothetical protein
MFLSIYHWLPVIGGYSAYPPRSAEYVNSLTDDLPNEDTLQTIVDTVDVGWILVRTAYLPADRKRAWNGPLPEGMERIQTFAGGDMVIRVTRQPRDDRRARLLSETETLAGVPLAELGAACPGAITLAEPPATPWQPNRRRKMTVEVHNDGTSAWPGRGFVPRHLVEVRACFGVADSTDCPPVHFALPADVPPGGSVRVPVSLVSPFFPGNFRIHVSLSQVGDGPLARCGVKPFSTPVRVGR